MSTIYGEGFVADSSALYDFAREAEHREDARRRAEEEADDDTRKARECIKAIRGFSERHAFALLACIQARVASSTWSHTDTASAVHDGIADCVGAIEDYLEKHE